MLTIFRKKFPIFLEIFLTNGCLNQIIDFKVFTLTLSLVAGVYIHFLLHPDLIYFSSKKIADYSKILVVSLEDSFDKRCPVVLGICFIMLVQ